jgi:zinc transport system ATP-binding protein
LIGSLSGGERQRAFIARSLAAEPKILILDEPTTGVDASAREQFYALLKKLNTEMKLTIVFVSHDIEVMTNEVTFVLALNQKLICHCSAHDFLSDETLKRLYGRDVELMHSHTH